MDTLIINDPRRNKLTEKTAKGLAEIMNRGSTIGSPDSALYGVAYQANHYGDGNWTIDGTKGGKEVVRRFTD